MILDIGRPCTLQAHFNYLNHSNNYGERITYSRLAHHHLVAGVKLRTGVPLGGVPLRYEVSIPELRVLSTGVLPGVLNTGLGLPGVLAGVYSTGVAGVRAGPSTGVLPGVPEGVLPAVRGVPVLLPGESATADSATPSREAILPRNCLA